jgi:hypothetical protein
MPLLKPAANNSAGISHLAISRIKDNKAVSLWTARERQFQGGTDLPRCTLEPSAISTTPVLLTYFDKRVAYEIDDTAK